MVRQLLWCLGETSKMAIRKCPYCHQPFDTEKTEAMPFCSLRCKMADLNGWFSEAYSIPVDIEKELEKQGLESTSEELGGETEGER